jgi:uncharacterized repeat protein (TIGR01451 family)
MKKITLYFFILINISIFAQVTDLVNCAGNSTFDLSTRTSELLGSLNPTQTIVSFHLSQSDAASGANGIANPTSYTAISSPQVIYARINNLGTITTNYFSLVQNSPLSASIMITSPISCLNSTASITVNATGGSGNYAYSISSNMWGTSGPVPSNIFSGLVAGVYEVTVHDSADCSVIVSVPIAQGPITVQTTVINATCFGETGSVVLAVTGGNSPYAITVSTMSGVVVSTSILTATNQIFPNLSAGVYTIQATDTSGCVASSNVIIVEPSPLQLFNSVTGNLITANASGGSPPYQYSLSNNPVIITPFQSSSVFANLFPGVYFVLVRDANGCLVSSAPIFLQPINAVDDTLNIYPINGSTAISTQSIFANDQLNGITLNPVAVNLSLLSTLPSGFSLNTDGTISVLSGTASGTYTFNYQICDSANPTICDTATVSLNVINEGILLKAFVDANGNNIQDNGELNFTQGNFGYEINNSGLITNVSSAAGDYFINESNPANTYRLIYTIDPAYALQYSLVIPSYNPVNVVANGGVVTYNFPVTALPFTDLSAFVYPSGTPPRPGFVYQNQIVYQNNGNQTIAAGTITFTNDSAISITNISQAGTMPITNGFTYNFANLLPGQSGSIFVTMQVPTIPTVSLGQILTNTLTSSIAAGDINLANNSSVLAQTIVGSYDPNDKVESHGGKILHASFTNNDYLTYTIQFENTGTYMAENVRVNDLLDVKLDETSVKMIKASHPFNLARVGNNLNWNFDGIELPPSVPNTQIGHGYVVFQIKPKVGYVVGDVIPNKAEIYFDFNPPIVTDIFNTKFVATLGISEFNTTAFTTYPNPTTGILTIASKNNTDLIDSVIVNDVLGKTVFTSLINSTVAKIDLSTAAKGIYFVKVKSEGAENIIKVVKE